MSKKYMPASEDGLTRKLKVHGRVVVLRYLDIEELRKFQAVFNSKEIETTLWFKNGFDKYIKLLDRLGFEWECLGNFTTGVYIKTTGYKY